MQEQENIGSVKMGFFDRLKQKCEELPIHKYIQIIGIINELVKIPYNKSHKKLNKTNSEEKDNSMFGKEILIELGINQDVSNEYENEENDLIR